MHGLHSQATGEGPWGRALGLPWKAACLPQAEPWTEGRDVRSVPAQVFLSCSPESGPLQSRFLLKLRDVEIDKLRKCALAQMNKKYIYLCNKCSSLSLCAVLSRSVVSNSLQSYGLSPSRLLCPGDSLGKNTGVGCHALPQGIFST